MKISKLSYMKQYKESETVRAFKMFAEKLQDPKYTGQQESQVFAQIATEIADELENDPRQN